MVFVIKTRPSVRFCCLFIIGFSDGWTDGHALHALISNVVVAGGGGGVGGRWWLVVRGGG
jgi:hypothetical protein